MSNIYTDHTYQHANPTWHEEDSPWKADRIAQMIRRNHLDHVHSITEIGCGAGEILVCLHDELGADKIYAGYDVSPDAYQLAQKKERSRLKFYNKDLLELTETFDLLLVIDVLEHIPNYWDFARRCREKAKLKIYHIPLEVSVQTVLRASFAFTLDSGRNRVGHLHFFTAESALMVLHETGHRIIDTQFTDGAVALAPLHRTFRRTIANMPRKVVAAWSEAIAARLLGGYSLLVLCE